MKKIIRKTKWHFKFVSKFISAYLLNFKLLKKMVPVSSVFGLDRGKPIDRYYIENFISTYKDDIRGCVLEIGDNAYTKMYGLNKVSRGEILHKTHGNSKATIIADLIDAPQIQSNQFDCIILTQTLQFIYDVKLAIKTLHRILKPGGVVLVTMSGISQISSYDMERWGDYWRFTNLSAEKLFMEAFSEKNLNIKSYGNVTAAISFLHGLAVEDLNKKYLDYNDPNYQVLITVRAIK